MCMSLVLAASFFHKSDQWLGSLALALWHIRKGNSPLSHVLMLQVKHPMSTWLRYLWLANSACSLGSIWSGPCVGRLKCKLEPARKNLDSAACLKEMFRLLLPKRIALVFGATP